MFKKVAGLSILVLIVLAACAAQNTPSSVSDTYYASNAAPEPAVAQGYASSDTGVPGSVDDGIVLRQASDENEQERLVLRTAALTLVVDDTQTVIDLIQSVAVDMGGWVVNSNTSQSSYYGQLALQGNISIRVPADRLDEALATFKESAVEVRSESIIGEDVTQQYTDTNSRLRNLEAAETQLQHIMEDARRTEDVLSVYNELVRVRSEIEVLRGQVQYFEQSATYSLINVTLQPNILTQPIQVGGWSLEGTARDAVETLIGVGQFVVSGVIWLAIVGVPAVLVLGALWRVVRMIWSRRTSRTVATH